MNLLEKKKEIVKNKKESLPPHVIEMGLNMLFVEPNNLLERIDSGLSTIDLVNDIEAISNIEGEKTIILDIRAMEYNEELDNIAYAKQKNEKLCVVVKDILFEEYQVYLSRVYQIDAILFEISHLTTQALKNIIFIAESMGLTPILHLKSEIDLKKIDWQFVKAVCVNDQSIMDNIPGNVKIIKDIDSNINIDTVDVLIKGE